MILAKRQPPSGEPTVKVDAFPESAPRYCDYDAVVCIDVIRATTTAITAVAQGRRVFPVDSEAMAFEIASRLPNALLAGETKGVRPTGFELQNSPVEVADRSDVHRPMVLLSSSGTHLIVNAATCLAGSGHSPEVYLASLRNMSATAAALSHHRRVALLGAGTRGEFRCEDQMAAAWIGLMLLNAGFEAEDSFTADLIERWSQADPMMIAWGNSAAYLRRSGQLADLDFIVAHIDDLQLVCTFHDGEVLPLRSGDVAVAMDGHEAAV